LHEGIHFFLVIGVAGHGGANDCECEEQACGVFVEFHFSSV
jgi:hypothetical protein